MPTAAANIAASSASALAKSAKRDARIGARAAATTITGRPPGGTYYPDDYYRDGRYYRERRLSNNDRIYRGRDNRYYCRRSDGTTGLIIGAGAGALIGNSLDGGRSSTLGTILGAVAGGALGREVDRNSSRRSLRCR
jgi:outer membrane lipoprotein SlyB